MINLCLFGAGRIGTIHAANAARHPQVRIKYIVDAYLPAAEKLAEVYGAEVVTTEQALADSDLHGVIIASSTNTHADLIEASARAGKGIFCEKPVDLNAERVRQCLAVVEQSGVACSIGFNRRYDPQFNALKEALDNGAIGALEMVSITSRDPSPPPLDYIDVSGGLFRDMMIHDFDMARWLLGEEVVEVSASGSCLVDPAIGEHGDIDSAAVTLKTASGKLCQISNSRRANYGYDQRIEAFGAEGMLQAGNQLESTLVVTGGAGSTSAKPEYFFLERYEKAYQRELDNFVAVMGGEQQPVANTHDGLMAILLADAALESMNTSRTVKL